MRKNIKENLHFPFGKILSLYRGLNFLFLLSTNKILGISRGLQRYVLNFLMNVLLILADFFKLLTDVQEEDVTFIWSCISRAFVIQNNFLNTVLKEFLSCCHLLHGRGSVVWGRKRDLPVFYLCVIAEVSWQVLRLFLSWKLCIAFSRTSASDNPQKLVPRDQFCFLSSTPRLIRQEPKSLSFDLPTWHLEHGHNAVR